MVRIILNGEIFSKTSFTGEICGALQKYLGSNGSIIRNCYNNANIKSSNNNVGGVSGYNTESIIENCYNTGVIMTEDKNPSYAGGIAGVNNGTSTIKNCYNIGSVTGKYTCIGGITGHNGASGQGTQILENVFNAGTIKEETTVATTDIWTSSNYLGNLIGYGVYNKTINGKYGNITIEEMKSWNNDAIVQNLGNGFKKNRNSNVNQGLPILVWQ